MEKHPHSAVLQFVSQNLFKRANTRNSERMKFQPICFSGCYTTRQFVSSTPKQFTKGHADL